MATTAEITVGGIVLLVDLFASAVLYFICNAVLGPIVTWAASYPIHPALQSGFWEITYVMPTTFGFILIFVIVIIISFVFILARRQVSPYEY
jgi:hypothetical protein